MDSIRLEWDSKKAKSNIEKHGVSFEEASTFFYDEDAVLFDDPDHSEDEDRFILLGMSIKANVLIVCHCTRENDSVIRIISARKATKTELEDYIKIQREW